MDDEGEKQPLAAGLRQISEIAQAALRGAGYTPPLVQALRSIAKSAWIDIECKKIVLDALHVSGCESQSDSATDLNAEAAQRTLDNPLAERLDRLNDLLSAQARRENHMATQLDRLNHNLEQLMGLKERCARCGLMRKEHGLHVFERAAGDEPWHAVRQPTR